MNHKFILNVFFRDEEIIDPVLVNRIEFDSDIEALKYFRFFLGSLVDDNRYLLELYID